jgi:hypothetical protein
MTLIQLQEPAELPANTEVGGKVHASAPEETRNPQAESEVVADSIASLINRVAGSSVQEIDGLIAELRSLRNLLHNEGARVQREITGYAHLSQSAMQTTNVIAENIAKFKSGVEAANRDGGKTSILDSENQSQSRASTGLRPDGGAVSLMSRGGDAQPTQPASRTKRLGTR